MTEPAQHSTVYCTNCGAPNPATSHFCPQCGTGLSAAGPPAALRPAAVPERVAPSSPPRAAGPASTRADPLIGVVIAERYRVLELLGRGGMGVVYRVEHARIGKSMALKLLTGELSRNPRLVARFKREAEMASRLSHPNTVQVFDFGTSGGLTYLAMEYLHGRDLGRLINEGPLSLHRTAKLLVQVCNSLAEAHDQGMVHRDIKPENIFVLEGTTGGEIVKVLDFGLAKLLETEERGEVTMAGTIVGTPFYMPPEQIRGEAGDPRADIYSLGALMHACLTGEPVFDAESALGVLSKHLAEEPMPPHVRRPDLEIPESVSAVVLRALAKDPDQRFQHVLDLQNALVDCLRQRGQFSVDELLDSRQLRKLAGAGAEGAVDAATRHEVERYERKLRRRGRAAWALAVLSIAGLSVGGWQLWRRSQAKGPFTGVEAEPNDSANEATLVPFGTEVRGHIGQRASLQQSDRDFYRIVVPPDTKLVRLRTEALPNFAVCTVLFHGGDTSPMARYCSGAPGMDLEVPALELEPGAYLLAVMQDRDQYSALPPPPVYENVSDQYRLLLERSEPMAEYETEPNDSVRDATAIGVGGKMMGRLGWMRDEDVFCVSGGAGTVRFTVVDAERAPRPAESVLQIVPHEGPTAGIPVRLYRSAGASPATTTDAHSPWHSPDFNLQESPSPCLTLSLAPNPRAPAPLPRVAPASNDEYEIRVERR